MIDLQSFAKSAIGVPFVDKGRDRSGWDCWGLCVCAYREVFGIELPRLDGEYDGAKSRSVPELVRRERQTAWKAVRLPVPGDVIVLRIRGHPWHCGLCIGGGQMLHVTVGVETCVERYNAPNWAKRIDGFWRYELLA